jgi:DNA-binding FadR family transcriptional regulator
MSKALKVPSHSRISIDSTRREESQAAWLAPDSSLGEMEQPRVARRQILRVHGVIARDIGIAIVSGRWRPGHVLERELEASAHLQVSRTAYRESLRMLSAKGLISSRPRTGTRVNPASEWHLLDPDVLAWLFRDVPQPEVLHSLFELRSIVEPAAAALAAQRRAPAHIERMRRALDDMRRYTLHRAEGRRADQEFHAGLLAATANPFLVSLTNGVTGAVDALTHLKLRIAKVKRDPVPDHVRVFDAIRDKDAAAAHEAMENLIRLAILDMPAHQRPKPAARSSASTVHAQGNFQ